MNNNDITKQNLRNRVKKCKINKLNRFLYDKHIENKLFSLKEYKKAKKILIFSSIQNEPNTKRIITKSIINDKLVALPICDKETKSLNFYKINSINDLHIGYYSILCPKNQNLIVDNFYDTICVVPGLAFDKNGNRLGRGVGYYDRFFAQHTVYSIALTYDRFLFDNIPNEPHDIKVNKVITERRIINLKGE